ncbi:MAG: DUF6883 domain-containing protein, partial [Planctomycetaceae bacterium]
LIAMGYAADEWSRLAQDLRSQHLTVDIDRVEQNDYGTQYVVIADLQGPVGEPVLFRSIWQIDVATDIPRFITMYPE